MAISGFGSIAEVGRNATMEMVRMFDKIFLSLFSSKDSRIGNGGGPLTKLFFTQQGLVSLCFCIFSTLTFQRTRLILSRNRAKQQINSMQHQRDMVANMLLGVAIGDSFGACMEFEDGETITRMVDGTKYVQMRYSFPSINYFYYDPGDYTDDTEMTLGMCRCLIDHRSHLDKVEAEDMLRAWVTEFKHTNTWKHFFCRTLLCWPRDGHGGFKYYATGAKTIEEVRSINGESARKYPGNAPIMRCLPLAFVEDDSLVVHLSRINTNSTHPHVKARAASLIMVLAARISLFDRTVPKEQVLITALERYLQLCKEHPDHFDQETFEYLQLVDSLSDYHLLPRMPIKELCGSDEPIAWATKEKGQPIRGLDSDAMRTVGCVLYLTKFHVSLKESLLAACRIGGDVDSLAAVLMGILCARFGMVFTSSASVVGDNVLPDFFIYEMEGVEYILNVAQKFSAVYD